MYKLFLIVLVYIGVSNGEKMWKIVNHFYGELGVQIENFTIFRHFSHKRYISWDIPLLEFKLIWIQCYFIIIKMSINKPIHFASKEQLHVTLVQISSRVCDKVNLIVPSVFYLLTTTVCDMFTIPNISRSSNDTTLLSIPYQGALNILHTFFFNVWQEVIYIYYVSNGIHHPAARDHIYSVTM